MSRHLRDDDSLSNPRAAGHLDQVIARAVAADPARRRWLQAGLGAALLSFLGGTAARPGRPAGASARLGFEAVATARGDTVVVPPGYRATPFLPWGDPVDGLGPVFRPDASNTAADQARQLGDNHDGLAFFGFDASGRGFGDRSDEGLLVINHEYVNPEYFYAPGPDPTDWRQPFTLEKARKAQAGQGVSVVHVRRRADGGWEPVPGSRWSRRLHANTPMRLQGPAAGHPRLRTAADPAGTTVLGTFANCGCGRTPWGTYLTCEENFDGYFGWTSDRAPTALERRYGFTREGFGLDWHRVDPRFDLDAHPNEANRFGWVVEIDPFDPASTPVKRTALGRFKHENAALVVTPSGRVVVYMGCDERNEYLYKFVSDGTFDPREPTSAANRRLLESGTLYVARFDAGSTPGDGMGTGEWIPLVHGQRGLTPAHGFTDPGDVLVRTRQAADRVGATLMDRPEWVAAHPQRPGEVYATLTRNPQRGTAPASTHRPEGDTVAGTARPPVDEANPRARNLWGHIVRWFEAGGDGAALRFEWDLFVLAGPGDPAFTSPDGLAFDRDGRLWIQTDGSVSDRGDYAGMGNNQMLVADPATREIRRFLVGPSGCEVTGATWTPDGRTLFVNIQHPGELGQHPAAPRHADGRPYTDNDIARDPTRFSQWPQPGVRPRSATLVITRTDGGVIGA